MLILNSYTINNFKNVKDFGPLAKEKITILSGVNSGGKSSIIQGLLLLKDFVLGKNDDQLDFTGLYVQLGDFQDVINFDSETKTIDLNFDITFTKSPKYEDLFIDLVNSLERGPLRYQRNDKSQKYSQIDISIELSFGKMKDSLQQRKKEKIGIRKYHVNYRYGDDSIYLTLEYKNDYFEIKSNQYDMVFPHDFFKSIFAARREKNIQFVMKDSIKKLQDQVSRGVKVSFDNQLFPLFAYNVNSVNKYKERSDNLFINDLYNTKVRRILESLANEINYLGPLRDDPKLSYFVTGLNKDDIGIKGENAPRIFYNKNSNRISFYAPPVDDLLVGPKRIDQLRTYVNSWASYILGNQVSYKVIKYSSENYGLFHIINKKKNHMTNVGVGASQIFPILVEGIRKKNGLFILEQPEIHLHPAAQARLADFLLCVCQYNNMKIIVETHSEHIINRIVRRGIRQEVNSKETKILFVSHQKLESIETDDIGMIINWPEGFLDTAIKENEKLYADQLSRLDYDDVRL